MILIQLILIGAFLFILFKFLANPTSYRMQAWQKLLAIFFFATAIFSVIFPEKLNYIANFVGVGRGADLLLYLLVLAFMFVVFMMYVKEAHAKRRLVRLVRAIALTEASQSVHNEKVKKNLAIGHK